MGDAAVEFVAAAGVGMGGLGQTAEGGVDVRGLERAVRRKVQCLAAVPLIAGIFHPKQEGATFFLALAAQFDLILPPSLGRHDQTCAEGYPAKRFQFVETERPHDVIGRRQKGAPAARAMLDNADRHPVEDANRAVPDEPFLLVRHAARFHA